MWFWIGYSLFVFVVFYLGFLFGREKFFVCNNREWMSERQGEERERRSIQIQSNETVHASHAMNILFGGSLFFMTHNIRSTYCLACTILFYALTFYVFFYISPSPFSLSPLYSLGISCCVSTLGRVGFSLLWYVWCFASCIQFKRTNERTYIRNDRANETNEPTKQIFSGNSFRDEHIEKKNTKSSIRRTQTRRPTTWGK